MSIPERVQTQEHEETVQEQRDGLSRTKSLGNIASADDSDDEATSGQTHSSLHRFNSDTDLSSAGIEQQPLVRSEARRHLFSIKKITPGTLRKIPGSEHLKVIDDIQDIVEKEEREAQEKIVQQQQKEAREKLFKSLSTAYSDIREEDDEYRKGGGYNSSGADTADRTNYRGLMTRIDHAEKRQRTGKISEDDKIKELKELYRKVQLRRIRYLKDPTKLFDAASGSARADEKARQIVEGSNMDYRVMRLAALFERNDGTTGKNGHFAAVMNWLSVSGLDKKELEYRYKIIRGKTLEEDLTNTFGGNPLKYQFLKQLYEQRSISKPAELALELGLLYEGKVFGPRMTHKMDYGRIQNLVKESPQSFTFLTANSSSGDIFEIEAYNYLKNEIPGFFGQLRNEAAALTTEANYQINIDRHDIKTGNIHADYLISLVLNVTNEKPVKKKDEKTGYTYFYREFDKHKVTSIIFAWAAKDDEHNRPADSEDRSAPLEELKRFAESGEAYLKNEPSPSRYTMVWDVMSKAPKVNLYRNRKIQPKVFGGFSDERLKFIHQWVKLIYKQRKKEAKEEQAIQEQASLETQQAEKLITEKETEEKKIKSLKDKKDPESLEEKKKATASVKTAEKELELIDLKVRERTENKAFDDATDNFRLKKLDILLEKHGTKWILSKKQERTNFKRKVLNLLSSGKKWDAQLAMIRHYMPEKWEKYKAAAVLNDYSDKDEPIPTKEIKNIFEKKDKGEIISRQDLKNDLNSIFDKLGPKLKKAGLEDHQVAQIKGMVLHLGANENKAVKEGDEALHYPDSEKIDKEYNTANYQKLKQKARKNLFRKTMSAEDAGKAIELVLKAKPDSLEQHLMLNDPQITEYIKEIAAIRGLDTKEKAGEVIRAMETLKIAISRPETDKDTEPNIAIEEAFNGLKSGEEVVITTKDMKEITDEKKNKEKYIKARKVARARGKSDIWWETEILKREMKEPLKEYKELSDFREKLWKREAKKAGAIEDDTLKLKDVKASFEDWAKEHEASEEKKDTVTTLKATLKSIEAMQEKAEAWKVGLGEAKQIEEMNVWGELAEEAELERETSELEKIRIPVEISGLQSQYKRKKDPEILAKIEELEGKFKKLQNLREDLSIASPEARTLARTQRIQKEVQEELQKDSTKKYKDDKKAYEAKYMPDKKDKILPLSDKAYGDKKKDYWAAVLVIQYGRERMRHDRNRFLELAFKAQQDEVKGKALAEKVKEMNPKAYRVMTSTFTGTTVGEDRAVATLKSFFEKDKKITVEDLLRASAGKAGSEKFSSDKDAFKFAFEELTDDELLTIWVGDSIRILREKANKRFTSNLNTSGDNADKQSQNIKETREIINTPVVMNPELEQLLHKVAKNENAVFEAKRKMFEKIGKAFLDNKTEEIYKLKLHKLEKQEIGMRILAENNIKAYKQTQTGAQWHFMNAAGMAASGAETNLLNALWREKPGAENDYGAKEESLKNIRELLKKAEISTDHWRDTQDRLNKQVIDIVVSILKFVAGATALGTGQIHALLWQKIVWAVIQKAVELTVEEVLKRALGREGEQDWREFVQKSVMKTATAVIDTTMAHYVKDLVKISLDNIIENELHGAGGFTGPEQKQEMAGQIKDSADFRTISTAVKAGFAVSKKEISTTIGMASDLIVKGIFEKNPEFRSDVRDHFFKFPDRTLKNSAEAAVLSYTKMGHIAAHPYLEESDPGATKRPKEFLPDLTPAQERRAVEDIFVQKWLGGQLSDLAGSATKEGLNAGRAMAGESAGAKENKKKVKPMEPDWDTRTEKYQALYDEYNPSKKEEVAGTVLRDLMDELGWSVDSELKKAKDVFEELEKELAFDDRQKLKPILEKRVTALFEGMERKFPHYKDRLMVNKAEIIKKLKDFGG